jgi:hypothetical protein
LFGLSIGAKIQVDIKKGAGRMQNNARVGGILSIVAGGLGCLSALMLILFAVLIGVFFNSEPFVRDPELADFPFYVFTIMYVVPGVIGLLLSALAIAGGVYALKKKNWGFALAGAIAGVLAFFPCGVVAVIFTSLGKAEFNAPPPVQV